MSFESAKVKPEFVRFLLDWQQGKSNMGAQIMRLLSLADVDNRAELRKAWPEHHDAFIAWFLSADEEEFFTSHGFHVERDILGVREVGRGREMLTVDIPTTSPSVSERLDVIASACDVFRLVLTKYVPDCALRERAFRSLRDSLTLAENAVRMLPGHDLDDDDEDEDEGDDDEDDDDDDLEDEDDE